MKALLFLTCIHVASAETRSLQYIVTAVTKGLNFPEFTLVGLVDGEPFVYYDSNIGEQTQKTEWIKKVDADDPDYWNSETQHCKNGQEVFKSNIAVAMKRFNQTEGVHVAQSMYGCELHDDGTKRGYWQDGYDGEDFIILDLNTLTWTAAKPQAVITKQKWESGDAAARKKSFLEFTCIEWLQKYVEYGKHTLERKVRPEVSLFQKDSSSPVVCHATGFFPKAVMISWQNDGEEVNEDVDLGVALLNPDGTFQKRSILRVSPEELNKNEYSCVVQHSSLEMGIVMNVADRRVLNDGESMGIIIGAVVAVLLLVLIACVGVLVWKKKKAGFKPVSTGAGSEGDSASNIS